MKKTRRAFTLIELLVVIAIISLLLSVLVPALRRVKEQATGAVCLANLKSLTAVWHAYSTENNGEIVPGHTPSEGNLYDPEVEYWIEFPQDDNGKYMGAQNVVNLEYELNGIKQGALYPYTGSADVYHCPGNKSSKLFAHRDNWTPEKPWWNSYSITGLMNGEEGITGSEEDKRRVVNKMSQITASGSKIVFLENCDDRGWLMGSWLMDYTTPEWYQWDVIAIWHRERGSIGFADGHAEMRQWVDPSTLENAEAGEAINRRPTAQESGDDIRFMQQGYIPGHR